MVEPSSGQAKAGNSMRLSFSSYLKTEHVSLSVPYFLWACRAASGVMGVVEKARAQATVVTRPARRI